MSRDRLIRAKRHGRFWVVGGLLVLAVLMVAALNWRSVCCQPPLAHDVYVWQRVWDDNTRLGLEHHRDDFARFRILVAQWDERDAWTQVAADVGDALAGLDVVPVIRLHGRRLAVDAADVAARLQAAIEPLEVLGARVVAVEIDHDSARAALGDYARWLRDLNQTLGKEWPLWITALPDWRHSADLAVLMQAANALTLQVHAVDFPHTTLMDPDAALDWLKAFNKLASGPLWVALPTYELRTGLNAGGRIDFIEAEAPLGRRAEQERALVMDPSALADWLDRLEEVRLRHLAGVVWFRLPTALDQRNLGTATLQALVHRQPIEAHVDVQAIALPGRPATRDIFIHNAGPHDTLIPQSLQLPQSCQLGHGLSGFRFRPEWPGFESSYGGLLGAGTKVAVGWVGCDEDELMMISMGEGR